MLIVGEIIPKLQTERAKNLDDINTQNPWTLFEEGLCHDMEATVSTSRINKRRPHINLQVVRISDKE